MNDNEDDWDVRCKPKCNNCPKCNKFLSVITFGPKCNKPPI